METTAGHRRKCSNVLMFPCRRNEDKRRKPSHFCGGSAVLWDLSFLFSMMAAILRLYRSGSAFSRCQYCWSYFRFCSLCCLHVVATMSARDKHQVSGNAKNVSWNERAPPCPTFKSTPNLLWEYYWAMSAYFSQLILNSHTQIDQMR